jgi:hypothetical protein
VTCMFWRAETLTLCALRGRQRLDVMTDDPEPNACAGLQMAVPASRKKLFQVPILWWALAAVVGAAIVAAIWKAFSCCCASDASEDASKGDMGTEGGSSEGRVSEGRSKGGSDRGDALEENMAYTDTKPLSKGMPRLDESNV